MASGGKVIIPAATRPSFRSVRGLPVPADIAVAGFDNREIAQYLQPPLTAVALPTRKIGVSAAAQILEHIRNPRVPPSRNIILCTIPEHGSI